MIFEEIKTDRLVLRKLSLDEFIEIYSKLTSEQQMVTLGLTNDEELERDRSKYQNGLTTHNKKLLYFQLLDRHTKKIIGWCGYHTWYIDHSRAEIGYGLFDESLKRKGLMTEAIKPIIDYGFSRMKLNRIEAFVGTNNLASIKLIDNLGFVKEGLMREHYLSNGTIEDSLVYSLLKREFIN